VVIPTFNGAHHLDEQLAALAGQDYPEPFDVVLADNGSTDATLEIARRWAGRVKLTVTDASAQHTIGYATNMGVRATRSQLIAFTDQDDVVPSQWLTALVRGAREADLTGGPSATGAINSRRTLRSRPTQRASTGPEVFAGFLPTLWTNSLAVWRDVYDDLGGFSDEYATGSDVDLCWRAQLAGYRLGFAPEASVQYRLRSTTSGVMTQRFNYGRSNVQLFRDFHPHGMPRQLWRGAGSWILMVVRIPYLLLPGWRSRWLGDLALRLGRLRGSIEYHCFYP
jgi:GT2 family glycosyltransferase